MGGAPGRGERREAKRHPAAKNTKSNHENSFAEWIFAVLVARRSRGQ